MADEAAPDSLQAAAWQSLRQHLVAAANPFSLPIPGQRPRTTGALILQRPVPCAYCEQNGPPPAPPPRCARRLLLPIGTYKQLTIYDVLGRWRHLPLCETHLFAMRPLVTGLRYLGKPAIETPVPPVPLDIIVERLRKERRVAHRAKAPTELEALKAQADAMGRDALDRCASHLAPGLAGMYGARDLLPPEAQLELYRALMAVDLGDSC